MMGITKYLWWGILVVAMLVLSFMIATAISALR